MIKPQSRNRQAGIKEEKINTKIRDWLVQNFKVSKKINKLIQWTQIGYTLQSLCDYVNTSG